MVVLIKVCDAIMGTGKSQSAITYMNEHSDQKFIYITPLLSEAARIKKGCPTLRFVEPNTKHAEYNHSKLGHTAKLIAEGRNIATTHQAFKMYTEATLQLIKEQEYTLIIDEDLDVLEMLDESPDDLRILVEAGYIVDDGISYKLARDDYEGERFRYLFNLLKSRDLIKVDEDENTLYYWKLTPELLTSFKDVFALTYLFEGQNLHHLLKMYNIPFEYINVEKIDYGTGFRFCDHDGYIPEYVANLKDMINIYEGDNLNSIGDNRCALSMNWYQKSSENSDRLRNHVSNYFKHINSNVSSAQRLWGCYKTYHARITGKGYTKAFLVFNTKATNEYRNRTCLAYLVNLFMNVGEKIYYQSKGLEVDEDLYALSTMVQWIWRSAIRDGKKINIYIPSKRMRDILTDWIDEVSQKGGRAIEN